MKIRPTEITLITIYHTFQAIMAAFGLIVLLIITVFLNTIAIPDEQSTILFVSILLIGIAFLLAIFIVAYIVVAYGVYTMKSWGRYGSIILAGLDVPNIPVGTICGILTLIYLLKEENAKLFD